MQILVIKRRSREAEILGRRLQICTVLLCLQASSITHRPNKPIKQWENFTIGFGFSDALLLVPTQRLWAQTMPEVKVVEIWTYRLSPRDPRSGVCRRFPPCLPYRLTTWWIEHRDIVRVKWNNDDACHDGKNDDDVDEGVCGYAAGDCGYGGYNGDCYDVLAAGEYFCKKARKKFKISCTLRHLTYVLLSASSLGTCWMNTYILLFSRYGVKDWLHDELRRA